jgi:putative transcriptional regulator
MRALKPAEIQQLREKRLDMTQEQFAATFHMSPWTLRKWEQGTHTPTGAAAVLLWLLSRVPDGVLNEILRVMRKS